MVYCMAYKVNPWSQQSFRLANPEDKNEELNSLSIIPNPFSYSFSIRSSGINDATEYTLILNTILGKQILHFKGTIDYLNKELQESLLVNQPSGIYLLTLRDVENRKYQFKLIKN